MTHICSLPFAKAFREPFWLGWGWVAGILLFSVVVGKAEPLLDVDDALEISVAGIPELKQRVVVQPDGSISFPLLGAMTVAGLPPSEARARIQAKLATKVFRQRGADGRETIAVIEPDQVTAMVAEFRPIVVNGDVAKPGQQPYRASMTVREAVALSGGYEIMRFRMNRNPFLESADLRSEYEAQWMALAKEQVRSWRIRTELGRDRNFDQEALMDMPVMRSTIAEVVRLEREQLDVHRADYAREKAYLQGVLKQAENHIGVLSEQLKKEDEGLQADTQDLKRVSDLFGKGAVPIPRVTEARRALLLSSTRKLQTTSQLINIQKLRSDLSRQLEKLDDDRKASLLRELLESSTRIAEIRTKLQSISEKLEYTGIVKSQLARGKGAKPEIVVIRKVENRRKQLVADEDFELQPGDVVEVALQEPLPDVPAP